MKFTIDRIDHVVMTCADLKVTAAWYQRVLGMEREEYGGKTAPRCASAAQKINLRAVAARGSAARDAASPAARICASSRHAAEDVVAQLHACGVAVEAGPVPRLGALGEMNRSIAATRTAT